MLEHGREHTAFESAQILGANMESLYSMARRAGVVFAKKCKLCHAKKPGGAQAKKSYWVCDKCKAMGVNTSNSKPRTPMKLTETCRLHIAAAHHMPATFVGLEYGR